MGALEELGEKLDAILEKLNEISEKLGDSPNKRIHLPAGRERWLTIVRQPAARRG